MSEHPRLRRDDAVPTVEVAQPASQPAVVASWQWVLDVIDAIPAEDMTPATVRLALIRAAVDRNIA